MHQITEKVALLEAITGYSFTDKRRGASALFTYNAYCPDFGEPTSIKKNDELAIYGDAVLRRHLCEKWLEKGLSKSEWNQIIQQTSSNANLASVGRAHGLGGCIVLNPGTTVVTDKMIATAMEAIIGAVSLDGGSNAVNRLLNALDLSHNLLRVVPPGIELARLSSLMLQGDSSLPNASRQCNADISIRAPYISAESDIPRCSAGLRSGGRSLLAASVGKPS